jgi:circadian clock protein KaiC
LSQEARERAAALSRQQEGERSERERSRKREALEARIAALRKEFEVEEEESKMASTEEVLRDRAIVETRSVMARSRKADAADGAKPSRQRRGAR